MNISSKDLPDLQMDTTFTSPQGNAAAQRALDYYLKPAVSEPEVDERFFDVKRHLSGEEALVHASDLLRCAAATAFKAAENLRGRVATWHFRWCIWWIWRERWSTIQSMANSSDEHGKRAGRKDFSHRADKNI